ncbi:hypothetical protein [Candidatus Marithrix sp. Canyon 246]|uniref:hypothetical protein n=1 Tax=Candidatus Marithrix sp. Canyon 246 TaxID=1827136 RepID=UPI00084A0670|nr:hypothetical protein [Candidatus Marithrix sp. Canyon 246]
MSKKLISFDWAIKKLLRSKTNFGILEVFLSELLKFDIKILEVLESESKSNHQQNSVKIIKLACLNLVMVKVTWMV